MLTESAIQKLRETLRGPTFRPGESGYDAARTVPNAMIDRPRGLYAAAARKRRAADAGTPDQIPSPPNQIQGTKGDV